MLGIGFNIPTVAARCRFRGHAGRTPPSVFVGWQTFNITPGLVLGVFAGYAEANGFGNNPEAVGSVSRGPHTAFVLRLLMWVGGGDGYLMQLHGDKRADLAGIGMKIDGKLLQPSAPPHYRSDLDFTNLSFLESDPPTALTVGGSHLIEFLAVS